MEDYIGAINTAISKLGPDDLTGDMRAPSPPKKLSAGKEAEPAMAAVLPIRGGGRGKGKGPAAKPTAAVLPLIPATHAERGPCLAGDQCPFFGTHWPCVQTHTKEQMDAMRKRLGPKYVTADDRRLRQIQQVEAALKMTPTPDANNAAADAAAIARAIATCMEQGSPVAAQPTAAAAPTLADQIDKGRQLLLRLKAAQDAHPQDGSVPSGAAFTSVPHIAMCSIGRVPAKEPSDHFDAVIPPGHAPGQLPIINNYYYITLPTAERPPIAASSDFCFGDFPACKAMPPQGDKYKTGAAQGNTSDSPGTGGRHTATDDLDGWADDAPWSPGRALRPCEYHRLQQANRASASYSTERMPPHCFQCPYSLPRHTADGSRSGR
jgi:hypothetical protein